MLEMTKKNNNTSSDSDDSEDEANVPPRQPTTKAKAKPAPTSDDSDSDNEAANSKNKKNNNDQESDSTDTDSEDSDDEDDGGAAARKRKKQRKRKKERLEQNMGRRQRTNSGAGPFSPDAEFRSFKVFSLASAVFIFITSVIAFQWNCLYAHICFVTEDPAVPQPQSDYIVPVIAVSLLLGLLSHLLIMSESPNSLLGFGVITLVWSICKYTRVCHCVESNSPRTCCLFVVFCFVFPFFHIQSSWYWAVSVLATQILPCPWLCRTTRGKRHPFPTK